MNEDMTESYIITKEEYLATNLPVREKHHEPFLLSYSNRVLPYNFIGNSHDEIPVKSAMKKYSAEAVKFAEQLLLAAGYFNGNRPVEKPLVTVNYTSLYLTYGNSIRSLLTLNGAVMEWTTAVWWLSTLTGKGFTTAGED